MLTKHLGLPRIRGYEALIVALLVDALGTGLYNPFSLLYFRHIAGLPLAAIGVTLTVATVLTLPMTPVTGALADRLGTRRLVIISQLLQAVGFLGYLVVHSIPVLFVTALLVTAGMRVFYAASAALIAEVARPDERDRWYGFVGATQSLGGGAGGLLAGLVVAVNGINGAVGYGVLILANVLSFLLSAALLCWYMADPPAHSEGAARHGDVQGPQGYRAVLADRPFLGLIACNVIFALCGFLLGVGLPIYATDALGLSTVVVGALFAFNTFLIVGAQTMVVRLLEPRRRTRVLLGASLIWVMTFGSVTLALAMPGAVLVPYLFGAMGLYTLGQLLFSPTATAMAAASSPAEGLRARYVATYEFSWGIAAALVQTVFGVLYTVGPAWPWIVVAALTLAAGLGVLWLEPHLRSVAVRASVADLSRDDR